MAGIGVLEETIADLVIKLKLVLGPAWFDVSSVMDENWLIGESWRCPLTEKGSNGPYVRTTGSLDIGGYSLEYSSCANPRGKWIKRIDSGDYISFAKIYNVRFSAIRP